MKVLLPYEQLRAAVLHEPMPTGVVLLDAFDRNVTRVANRARAAKKTVRIATKSVRAPALLKRALEVGKGAFRGLLCYSAREAAFLASQGFDDIVLAYPPAPDEWAGLARLAKQGVEIVVMVDSPEHCVAADAAANAAQTKLLLAIDIDASFRPLGGLLHLGVRRSPVRSQAALGRVLDAIRSSPRLGLVGAMSYEAQIAGLGESNPFFPVRSILLRLLKPLFRRSVAALRARTAEQLNREGAKLRFFNGGGTGSLRSTLRDRTVTEVTVGSGLLQSHLFDYYDDAESEPALFFATPVTRIPEKGIVVCQGGGFVASGPSARDRLPRPVLPSGLRFLADEGPGEVQTPLRGPGTAKLQMGEPVFFRPAKTGELAERFSEYVAIIGDRIVERIRTYRGLGQTFP